MDGFAYYRGFRSQDPERPKPSRMPNLGYGGSRIAHRKPQSVMSTPDAINVIAVLRQELQKVGCVLVNYKASFHSRGIDVKGIKVFTANTSDLRKKVKDMDINGELDHEDLKGTTRMALTAVKGKVEDRLQDEHRLEAQLFMHEGSDIGSMSVTVPVAGKEEPMIPPPPPIPPAPAPEMPGEPGGGDIYAPSDEEMDLEGGEGDFDFGEPADEEFRTEGAPHEAEDERFPGAIEPEDEFGPPGRASDVPDLI